MLWRTSPTRSRRSPSTGFIRPCQPRLVDRPPAGSDWRHEVKHDGYRIVARKQGERVTLWSRTARVSPTGCRGSPSRCGAWPWSTPCSTARRSCSAPMGERLRGAAHTKVGGARSLPGRLRSPQPRRRGSPSASARGSARGALAACRRGRRYPVQRGDRGRGRGRVQESLRAGPRGHRRRWKPRAPLVDRGVRV